MPDKPIENIDLVAATLAAPIIKTMAENTKINDLNAAPDNNIAISVVRIFKSIKSNL